MEMVSAAKLRRSEAILMAGRPYAQKLQELLGRLASSEAAARHEPKSSKMHTPTQEARTMPVRVNVRQPAW